LTTPDGARKAAALELVGTLTTVGYSADTLVVRRHGAALNFVKAPKVGALRQTKAAKAAAELAELRAEIERLKAGK
jgi:hypothetical protein